MDVAEKSEAVEDALLPEEVEDAAEGDEKAIEGDGIGFTGDGQLLRVSLDEADEEVYTGW